jgi:hypothetical protein
MLDNNLNFFMLDIDNFDSSNNIILKQDMIQLDQTPSQIFKSNIPIEMLIDLFEKICMKCDNHYILNNNAYKKGIFNGDVQQFLKDCTSYYHTSKRKYLTRTLNYNHFITIIRQICKHLNIKYNSKIRYEKSTYDIIYNIYLH